MNPVTSAYLDAVRFCAAMLVFVTHFSMQRISGGLLWQITSWGHEAVAVFFVLSGYVMAHSTQAEKSDGRTYTLNRAARLGSVAVPAVLLTTVLDVWGQRLSPQVYSAVWGYQNDLTWTRFLTALTFTHELWGQSVHQGSNAAYWSLGYEVPYYLIYGLWLYAPPPWRWPALVISMAIMGPPILLALPVWLAGVGVYRCQQTWAPSASARRVLTLGPLALWLVYQGMAAIWGRPQWTGPTWMARAELPQLYVAGTVFALHLLGFTCGPAPLMPWLQRHARTVRWLAGGTFSLYLFHLPIASFLVALQPWAPADWRARTLVFVGTLVLVGLLAQVTERQKDAWRRGLRRLTSKTAQPPAR